MKNNKILILGSILLLTFFLFSCSSDDAPKVDIGVSTGNYFPLALNNEWNFSIGGADPISQKIIGTEVIGGDSYYKFSGVNVDLFNSEVNYWISKKGGTYFQKIGDIDLSLNGVSIKINSYELEIFKDYLAVNQTWTDETSTKVTYTVDGQGSYSSDIDIINTGKILQRDATVTVNNKVYTNVIKMSLRQEVPLLDDVNVVESVYWYAKDVGPIKNSITNGGITTVSELVSYNVNN